MKEKKGIHNKESIQNSQKQTIATLATFERI